MADTDIFELQRLLKRYPLLYVEHRDKMRQISFNVSDETFKKLRKLVYATEKTKTDIINEALEEHAFKKHAEHLKEFDKNGEKEDE